MSRGSTTVLSRRRFDVDEYHRMAEAGILRPDDRVELLDGELVEMTSIGARHAACVVRLNRVMLRVVGSRVLVSSQNPVRLDRFSEPRPDLILLRPRFDDYAQAHPEPDDVFLLIEVADTSLPYDRGIKLAFYAAAGISEVWIVDLATDAVEVHRDPVGGHEGGAAYATQERVTTGSLAPAALPDLSIALRDILPPLL